MEFWLIALCITGFGNQKSYVLPKQHIFVFFMDLRTKSTALTDWIL